MKNKPKTPKPMSFCEYSTSSIKPVKILPKEAKNNMRIIYFIYKIGQNETNKYVSKSLW